MTLGQRIQAFSQLGNHLEQLGEDSFASLAENARIENPWFTKENVSLALQGLKEYLKPEPLNQWTSSCSPEPSEPKTIALVMAGNIPLVGFHDFLCVLISGHRAQIKFSSKDSKLFRYLIKQLVWFEPGFETYISVKDKLENFDAIIATGSDNSSRYFEYYFGKYPNIIRKNRTSCAVLTGFETEEDLKKLGTDIFSYFGLGCRNVSKLYVPRGYDFQKLLSSWDAFRGVIHHHKYANNYDYQKSILLVNRVSFLDNGFVLLQENERLVSPIAVLYYESYGDYNELKAKLKADAAKLQCVIGTGENMIPFGRAQFPQLWDYADQVDTLQFLSGLN